MAIFICARPRRDCAVRDCEAGSPSRDQLCALDFLSHHKTITPLSHCAARCSLTSLPCPAGWFNALTH